MQNKSSCSSSTWTVVLLLFVCFAAGPVNGQEQIRIDENTIAVVPSPWEMMTINSQASLRGLHVLDRLNVWASGSGGTIINTRDGGKTWNVTVVKGAEELDFRDIHAIDEDTIVAMTSGTPARIYRSTDGGSNWKITYQNQDPRVFLDALSFWDDQHGIVMGDPINNLLFLLRTTDGGLTWNQTPAAPRIEAGEAGFAASGTNAIARGSEQYFVALGGAEAGNTHPTSRVLLTLDRGQKWYAASVPINRAPAAGIFSLCFVDDKHGVAVGGDYQKPDVTDHNVALTNDGGRTWSTPSSGRPPSGYRSCVAVNRTGREIRLIAVGPNGTDLSTSLGSQWRRISNQGFHAVDFTADGQFGWACGGDGKIAKWTGKLNTKPQEK
jgi:photosystem II stability/assembly factor-like uncharacterized protein